MATRTWTLKIRGDSTDAVRAAKKTEQAYDKLGGGINKKLSSALGKTEGRFGTFRTRVSQSGATVAAAFGGAAIAGVAALGAGFVSTFKAAEESIKIGKQTEQVIKTIGAGSWTSADKIGKLAEKLSTVSGVDDEVIQSGANLLLTFKNIKNQAGANNDVFDRTVAAANDMSVALGQDMKSSSIQLGKALNDPVKGVSALQRVGVSFTQKQKDQIKTLVESGDSLKAQKIILKEVESQFGGTAAAVANPWDKLKVTLGNLQERIGIALMPTLNGLVSMFAEKIPVAIDTVKSIFDAFMAGFRNPNLESGSGIFRVAQEAGQMAAAAWPHIQAFGSTLADVGRKIVDFFKNNPTVLFTVLGTVIGGIVVAAVWALVSAVVALLSPFVLVTLAVAALAAGVVYAYQKWGWFKTAVDAIVRFFVDVAWPAIQRFVGFVIQKFGEMVDWIKRIWPQVQEAIGHVINVIRGIISGFVTVAIGIWNMFGNTILGFARTVWNAIKTVISSVINIVRGIIETVLAVINGDWGKAWNGILTILKGVWGVIRSVISIALGAIKAIISAALTVIKAIMSAIWSGIKAVTSAVWNGIKSVISGVWSGIKSVVSGSVGWVRDRISSGLGAIRDIWNKVWGGMRNALGGIWDGIKKGVSAGINKVIDVINFFIKLINKIPGIDLPTIGHVGGGGGKPKGKRAMGGFITNGPMMHRGYEVGEGNPAYPEAVIATDPRYRRRNLALLGWAANQLGVQSDPSQRGFAIGGIIGGIGDVVGNVAGAVGDIARTTVHGLKIGADVVGGFLNDIRAATLRPVANTVKGMINHLPIPDRLWGKQIKGMGTEIVERMYRWAAGKADESSRATGPGRGSGGPGPHGGWSGGGVERWRGVALQALQMAGAPLSWIGSLLRRMNQESGGNPYAINRWDSNARKGIPSQGLMQVIPPTFAAHAGPLRGRGILDPLANIYASIKYTIGRYGSGPAGWDRAGGYKRGGILGSILGFRRGGVLGEDVYGHGLTTGRPHLMHAGERVVPQDRRESPTTVVHIGKLVVGGDTPAETRRNAHIFADVLERRQIEHDARMA